MRSDGLHTVRARLPDPIFAEAAGVLEMIARTPEERDLYEARLKLQRDEQSRIEAAEARGEAKGRVRVLEELLGLVGSSLEGLTLGELATRENDLHRQLRERG